jgi:hypothetical protein
LIAGIAGACRAIGEKNIPRTIEELIARCHDASAGRFPADRSLASLALAIGESELAAGRAAAETIQRGKARRGGDARLKKGLNERGEHYRLE